MTDIYNWSRTAADNDDADSGINWAEGQTAASVNDSARAMMARIAEWRDDLGATQTTGGTANAHTLTARSSFTAYATGIGLAFKAGATNTGATTLNVNGIGAKAVRKITVSGETALSAGDITADGLYLVTYDAAANSAAGAWVLINPASVSSEFTTIELGHASDTTLARASSGDMSIEGNIVYRAGGTDVPVTDGGTGASTAANARTNLGVAIGSDVQAHDAGLDDIAGLAVTDGNFIVGDGSNWVAESGATVRTSLGLGSIATQSAGSVTITGGSVTGITDITVADGGTGRSSHTAYAVLCGGTTTTGAQQSIAGVGTSGQILTSNGAGALPTFEDADAGLDAASQAEMETGTSNTVASTPGRQHFHPGHPKTWARISVSGGTPSLDASYNVTSITDTGTGEVTITIGTDFSSADWAPLAMVETTGGVNGDFVTAYDSLAAGSVLVRCFNVSGSSTSDPNGYSFSGFGDQA